MSEPRVNKALFRAWEVELPLPFLIGSETSGFEPAHSGNLWEEIAVSFSNRLL